MKFLSVGGVKLKVIFSPEECEKYGVEDIEHRRRADAVRRLLSEILDSAEKATDFKHRGEKLLVLVYPLESGGAELFITKLSSLPEREQRTLSESGITTFLGRVCHYKLDGGALTGLFRTRGEILCDLYRSITGDYYISVSESILDGKSDAAIFDEYGERIASLPYGIDGEWGEKLLSGARLSEGKGK